MRGLLLHDRRATCDSLVTTQSATWSNYDEAGSRPGTPTPTGTTEMVLQASGSQSSGGKLDVKAIAAGHVGDGRFVWKGDSDSTWRGWDPPTAINTAECLSGSVTAEHPHAVTLADGTILVVADDNNATLSIVRLYSRAPSTGTWTASSIHSEAADGTKRAHPCLVVVGTRVLCIFAVYDADNNLMQLRVYRSDDSGSTWSLHSKHASAVSYTTAGASAFTLNRLRAAYSAQSGQLLVVAQMDVASLSRQVLYQLASDDLGGSFSQVSAQSGSTTSIDSGQGQDVIADESGGFIVLWHPDWTISGDAFVYGQYLQLANAYDVIFDGSYYVDPSDIDFDFTGSSTSRLELAFCRSPEGAIWAYGLAVPASGSDQPLVRAAVSEDGGLTFSRAGYSSAAANDGNVWINDAGQAYPADIAVCWHRGRAVLFTNSQAGSDDDALYALYLGGYATTTRPSIDLFESTTNGLSWSKPWVPYELPTASGYTGTGTASSEVIATDGHLDVTVGAGNTYYYSLNVTTTLAKGIEQTLTISTTTNTALELRAVVEDASEGYDASIRITSTQVSVYDNAGSTTVGSTLSTSSGDRIDLVLAVANGKVYAAARVSTQDEDRDYTILANGTALTDQGATGSPQDRVEFGHIQGVNGSTWTLYSHGVAYGSDYTVSRAHSGQTNPDDLRGRPFAAEPLYVDDGVRLAATDGPAATGDQWDIDAVADYSIDHLCALEHPSPSVGWRSDGVPSAPPRFAYTLESGQTAYTDTDLWAVYLKGHNSPKLKIEYDDDATGNWVTITTADLRTSFAFQRTGTTVRPSQSGSVVFGAYVERNELAGGTIVLPTNKVRRIAGNSEGWLTSGSTIAERRCTIFMDSDDADDTEGMSGTASIIPPDALVILHRPFDGNAFSGLRFTLDPDDDWNSSQAPAAGYAHADKLVYGPVAVFGRDYSQSRRRQHTPNVDLRETSAGVRWARSLGPSRTRIEVAWDEGVDLSRLYDTADEDDYILGTSTSGAEPIAGWNDAPLLARGLLEELDGPATAVVYLPRIPAGTPDEAVFTLKRARGAFLSRMVGPIELTTVLGEEESSELVRCSLTLEEEV